MKDGVLLYDRHSIQELNWPDTEYGRYAQQYISAMLEHPAEHFIANVQTTVKVVVVDGLPVPITVNEAEYANSYVCSPYTHYVSYASEELALLNNRLLEGTLSVILRGMGFLLRAARFNRVVQVNNWLLSTNLYPPVSPGQLLKVIDFLRSEYPGYTVLLRSLSWETSGALLEALEGYGCKWVPSRQIYLLQHPTGSKAKWLVKRDRALLDKHGYTVEAPGQITAEDVTRIVELYELLYIHKYSEYNPQFTEAYIRLALEKRTLHIYGLRKNGRLDAVLGFYSREGAMTAPLFGYDTSLSQPLGLYRMLSAVLIDLAGSRGQLLHESSGVGQFKRNRGAVAATELSAVFDQGTSRLNRCSWSFLGWLLRRVGIPLIQKLKL
ncbi:GNAT family N-acetyltransferase [Paenibacillus jilunlii]|uniref:Acetyltransferase (GNAT) domain-containing protein n=1 Tax=Paenibacillus jilunlii TaxID=682956 RepID=A0A1G9GJS8_9BACL|nr:GNAT family N-acetyltransferase [Paenibacillus jilunlii]SDL00533.1 Acetyltransferase (GNAT) domain-containing protein [Paenibacillus jilunlii]